MKNDTRLPKEFEERMAAMLGADFNSFLKNMESLPPVSVRVNPNKQSSVEGAFVPWSKYGRYLTKRPVFTLDPSFHAGAYYVQEASSMLLEQALIQSVNLNDPLRILDLSAAPGGKSTHILSLLNSASLLVSNEVIRSRAYILFENIQKWGHSNVVITNNDPENFKRVEGFFDVIIVDAPCSGEGLFRKDADAIQEWSVDNAALCAMRQRRILSDVLPALREGGILIYSTCTYNEAENEDNLVWLGNEFGVTSISLSLDPHWGIQTTQKNNVIGYRCYPHKVNGEGFFISVLRKNFTKNSVRSRVKRKFMVASKKVSEKFSHWLKRDSGLTLIQQENLIIALPELHFDDIQYLSENLNILSKGTALAELKHEKLIPDHASALSIHLENEGFNRIDLDEFQALSYLRKESPQLTTVQRGFALVSYQGNNLGWVNLLGNRINNLYPSTWRIRMGS
jgi:16S rRNA C967 or C1407 C5-methylase (RsmB/RsmF family)/NOL1/NOP2/fmu family ribosome biogenesis protein